MPVYDDGALPAGRFHEALRCVLALITLATMGKLPLPVV
jgi:hypothetical protein